MYSTAGHTMDQEDALDCGCNGLALSLANWNVFSALFAGQQCALLCETLEQTAIYTSQLSILCELRCSMVDEIVNFVMKASVQSMAGSQVLSPQSQKWEEWGEKAATNTAP